MACGGSLSLEYNLDAWKDWVVVTSAREGEDPLSKWPWYKGRMSRAVAEEYLSQSLRLDGTFLVRESDALSVRSEPIYVISVLHRGTTHHVEIEATGDGYALAFVRRRKAKSCKTLNKLIDHYQKKAIDLEEGGSTKLKYILEG